MVDAVLPSFKQSSDKGSPPCGDCMQRLLLLRLTAIYGSTPLHIFPPLALLNLQISVRILFHFWKVFTEIFSDQNISSGIPLSFSLYNSIHFLHIHTIYPWLVIVLRMLWGSRVYFQEIRNLRTNIDGSQKQVQSIKGRLCGSRLTVLMHPDWKSLNRSHW